MHPRTACQAICLLVAAALFPLLPASGAAAFDDHDWRAPDLVARSEGIEHEMTPALLLKTEMKNPVFLFDPTDDETITHITDFQDKLYLASCTRPADTDTGSVFTYDPESHQWQKAFQVNEQGLVWLQVHGDRLYIPGYDANDGGWDLGNVYVHDGQSWVERRTVPRAFHIYGLAVYRDRIYVSADIFDEPPAGMTVDEAGDKGLIDVYGRVVSSADEGQTWREEYRGPQPGQDVGFMTVFQDKLILNAHGDLVMFDGDRWTRLNLNPDVLLVYDYESEGDALVMGTSFGLCFFDGKAFRHSQELPNGQVRAISRFGPSWVVATTHILGATFGHGPGSTQFLRLRGNPEEAFFSGLYIVPADLFHEVASGRGTRPAWWQRTQWILAKEMLGKEMFASSHAFKGRLYFGTHPEGRVLVLPVVSEGTLESAPRPIGNPGDYLLSWESATPPGTSCRLQVRVATSAQALDRAPFVGPDGKPDTYFDAPGARLRITEPGLLQYRVILKTDDPALTPYLKRVSLHLARGSVATSKPI